MATGSVLDVLARAIGQANTTDPAWTPRAQKMSLHQGTLSRVDPFNGVADFQFPDSDGSTGGLIVPGVNIIRPYASAADARVGHVVWGIHNGTDFMIFGQHQVLNGSVRM